MRTQDIQTQKEANYRLDLLFPEITFNLCLQLSHARLTFGFEVHPSYILVSKETEGYTKSLGRLDKWSLPRPNLFVSGSGGSKKCLKKKQTKKNPKGRLFFICLIKEKRLHIYCYWRQAILEEREQKEVQLQLYWKVLISRVLFQLQQTKVSFRKKITTNKTTGISISI